MGQVSLFSVSLLIFSHARLPVSRLRHDPVLSFIIGCMAITLQNQTGHLLTTEQQRTMDSNQGKRSHSPTGNSDTGDAKRGKLQEGEEKEEEFEIDFETVANAWSPTRLHRTSQKPRSREEGNFRGGDYVFDGAGNATTVSLFFEKDSYKF